MADYLNFQGIYEAIQLAIGDTSGARNTEVKAVANMVYLNEICQCDELYPLFWLLECDDTKKSKTRKAITGITAANPVVVSATAHGFVDGDLVTLYGISGMTELNYRTFVVDNDSANAFHLHDFSATDINGTSYTAWTSGGYVHHRGTKLTSCNRVLRANWHGYNKGLDFIGLEQLENESKWWDDSISRPQKMMHRKTYSAVGTQADYLLWFQCPEAVYYMRLWYEKQCARLSETTDVPLLPYQFHDAIIAGAITRLGENKVQVEAGVVWPVLYKAHIDAIKAFNRKWWAENKPYERSPLFLA